MLIWSIGSVPFKDDFWSGGITQPGCPYESESGCFEPNPRLEATISALSGGPIAPSDTIGYVDRSLVLETCRADGVLLKPSKPATTLDSTFIAGYQNAQEIMVWHTFSSIGDNMYNFVLAIDLAKSFTVGTSDLVGNFKNGAWAYEYCGCDSLSLAVLTLVDSQHELTIPAAPHPGSNTPRYYKYYIVAPIQDSWWSFLGELNKIISVSSQRVTGMKTSSDGIVVVMQGVPNESITAAFMRQGSAYVESIVCSVGATGMVSFSCDGPVSPGCTCSST